VRVFLTSFRRYTVFLGRGKRFYKKASGGDRQWEHFCKQAIVQIINKKGIGSEESHRNIRFKVGNYGKNWDEEG